mgnify:CR=1
MQITPFRKSPIKSPESPFFMVLALIGSPFSSRYLISGWQRCESLIRRTVDLDILLYHTRAQKSIALGNNRYKPTQTHFQAIAIQQKPPLSSFTGHERSGAEWSAASTAYYPD